MMERIGRITQDFPSNGNGSIYNSVIHLITYLKIVIGKVKLANSPQIQGRIGKGIKRHPTQIHNFKPLFFYRSLPLMSSFFVRVHSNLLLLLLLLLVHHFANSRKILQFPPERKLKIKERNFLEEAFVFVCCV